jgi:hypothetical protein
MKKEKITTRPLKESALAYGEQVINFSVGLKGKIATKMEER